MLLALLVLARQVLDLVSLLSLRIQVHSSALKCRAGIANRPALFLNRSLLRKD
jgi:hypothetical protein